ncbi:hypothetical protein CL622_07275 [archaeon]|nr:hypothetical protein [archaeon]|tara:strand:+ start:3675 stop:4175 length:501 start_codon:yes stop_codon:yes gene_type:complete
MVDVDELIEKLEKLEPDVLVSEILRILPQLDDKKPEQKKIRIKLKGMLKTAKQQALLSKNRATGPGLEQQIRRAPIQEHRSVQPTEHNLEQSVAQTPTPSSQDQATEKDLYKTESKSTTYNADSTYLDKKHDAYKDSKPEITGTSSSQPKSHLDDHLKKREKYHGR